MGLTKRFLFVPHQSEPDYLLRINDLGVARTLPLQIRTKERNRKVHRRWRIRRRSDPPGRATTQRDRHLEAIKAHGKLGWQKATAYGR